MLPATDDSDDDDDDNDKEDVESAGYREKTYCEDAAAAEFLRRE